MVRSDELLKQIVEISSMTIHHGWMTRLDLDPDLLRCFIAVADTRGFTAAGELIGLTQSGISVRIRNLEERLGRRLLNRSSRSVGLTEAGELFLGYARRLIDLNDEAVGRIRGASAAGRLRLGIADYAIPRLVPGLLGRFARLQPGVKMEMRTGLSSELKPAFDHGELDLVIAGRSQAFEGGRLLYRDPLKWIAAPGFQLQFNRPLPLAALPSFCTHRKMSLQALDHAGIGWEIIYTSTSTTGLHAAVLGGLGIAAVPESSVSPQFRVLTVRDGMPAMPESEIALFIREDALTPSCQAFAAFLGEELGMA
jgi:DNA-binding transcriptional LysR family regulator